MRSAVAALAALSGAASAALTSSAYTDSTTGITFQRFVDDDTGYTFGMALPENPDTDFIGQMVAPGSGWAGASLTSSMMASVLIVAWPNGDDVVASLRKTNAYSNPAVLSDGPALYPIAEGTFVNSTHYSYTFLCQNCITGDSASFDITDTTAVLGWALSDTAPTTPSSASSVLAYHSTGFGEYGMQISEAESADYSTWAALASTSSSSSGSNSTTSSNSTTTPGSATSTPVSTPLPSAVTLNTTYDYIVVGGGAAGLIVAERLAETNQSVLLLERGSISTASTGGNDTLSWNSSVTPYDVPAYNYAVSDTADVSYCTDTASTAGCILGGSTMINAEMFVKPQEADFENWPTGWQWSDIAESANAFYERNPGSNKPSSDGRYYYQGVYNILSTLFKSNGWSEVDAIEEPNKKTNVFAHPPWNIKDSLRAGPVMTYLPLAQQYSNFKLQLNTKVLRVIRSGSAVTGVEVQTSTGATQIINVNTNGKIVLAAGALSSPRILFNSGIGPADQLEIIQSGTSGISLNSSDYVQLPVGKGLKDHPIFTITADVNNGNLTAFDPTSPSTSEISLYAQGAGPLSEGMQRLNFWTSVEGSDNITRYVQGTTSASGTNAIKIKVYLTHGLTSEGRLGITADGSTEFITNPWMNTAADKEAITTFLNQLIAYINKSGTLTIDSTTGGNITAADLISNYVTGDHFVGTAKMGTDDGRQNGTAVVDTNTKVYGTDNLFVVDASMHPDLPTGNTQAIVMVAAEHAVKKIIALSSSTSTESTGPDSGSSTGSSSGSSAGSSSAVIGSVSATATNGNSGSETYTSTMVVGQTYTVTVTNVYTQTATAGQEYTTAVTQVSTQTAAAGQTFTTTVTEVYTQTATAGQEFTTAVTQVSTQIVSATGSASAPASYASVTGPTTFATSVVVAATSSTPAAFSATPVFTPPAIGAISNWTAIIPSGALTSTLPSIPTATVSGVATPDTPLPEGTTVKDLLEWFTFVLESIFQSKEKNGSKNHRRYLANA